METTAGGGDAITSEMSLKSLKTITGAATSTNSNATRARRQGRLGKENRGSSSRKKTSSTGGTKVGHTDLISSSSSTSTSGNKSTKNLAPLSSGNSEGSSISFTQSSPSDSGRSSLGVGNNPRENSSKTLKQHSDSSAIRKSKVATNENKEEKDAKDKMIMRKCDSDASSSAIDNDKITANSDEKQRIHFNELDKSKNILKVAYPVNVNGGDHTKDEKSPDDEMSKGDSSFENDECPGHITTANFPETSSTFNNTQIHHQNQHYTNAKSSKNLQCLAFDPNTMSGGGGTGNSPPVNSQILYIFNQLTGQIMMVPVAGNTQNASQDGGLSSGRLSEDPALSYQFQMYPQPTQQQQTTSTSNSSSTMSGLNTGTASAVNTQALLTSPTDEFAQQQQHFLTGTSSDFQTAGLLPLFLQPGTTGAELSGSTTTTDPAQLASTVNWNQQAPQSGLFFCPSANGSNFVYSTNPNGGQPGFFNVAGSSPLFIDSTQSLPAGNQSGLRNSFLLGGMTYNNSKSTGLPFTNGMTGTNGSFQGPPGPPGQNRGLFFAQLPMHTTLNGGQTTRSGKKSQKNQTHNQTSGSPSSSNSNQTQNGRISSPGQILPARQTSNGSQKSTGNNSEKISDVKNSYGHHQRLLLNYDALPFLNPDILKPKRHSSQTNLYLRGLPKDLSEEQLHALAPDKLLIRSVKLIVEDESECYGFIDFNSNESAKQALNYIKENNPDVYVNFAYESEKDPLNIYITNIPEIWTASNVDDLKKIFEPYGQISTAIVMTKRSNNFCTGAGFVRFCQSDDAQKAIEGIRKAQIILEGAKRPLEVKLADRQKTPEEQALLTQLKQTTNTSMKNAYRNFEIYPKQTLQPTSSHVHQSSFSSPDDCQATTPSKQPYRSHKAGTAHDFIGDSTGYHRSNLKSIRYNSNGATAISTTSLATTAATITPSINGAAATAMLSQDTGHLGHPHHSFQAHPHNHHQPEQGMNPFTQAAQFNTFVNSQAYNSNKMNFAVAMLQNSAAFSAAVAAAAANNNHQGHHQYVPENVYFPSSQWTNGSNNFTALSTSSHPFTIQ